MTQKQRMGITKRLHDRLAKLDRVRRHEGHTANPCFQV